MQAGLRQHVARTTCWYLFLPNEKTASIYEGGGFVAFDIRMSQK